MAKWQKVITSGSSPILAHVTASGGYNSPGTASFGDITGTISTATQAKVDHDSLLNFVANEHIDHSGVSVVAGTGLTGGGTIAANRTLNVIGGDGITANANDIAITAAQTTITSIFATDLKIGEDAQTAIDFETADEIHLDAANAQVVNIRAGGIVVTGDITASAGISASQFNTNYGPAAALGPGTGSFGHVTASFGGDGSRLINVTAVAVDIDGLSALGGTGLHQTQDHFLFSDNGTEKKITFSNLEDAIFGNLSGDATVAAAGAITLASSITSVGSILKADLVLGEDAQTKIDFETANQIHLDADNAQVVNVRAGGIEVTGDVTASAGIKAVGEISGSGFITPLGTVSGFSGSFGDVSASGTILAAKLDAAAVSDALAAAIVAEIDNDEIPIAKLAEDAVTVTAGTGLTGAGAVTLGGAVTMNVIGGDGITANANDIAITAAQTTITSIFATDLKIGEDAQTAIDFETANEIHLDANNAQVVNVRAGGIEVTGDVTASAGIHAAAVISGSGFTTPLGTVTALSGAFGDISASGTILAAKLDALAVSDALAAAIVAEIDNDEIPIAKLAEDAVTVTAGTGLTGAGAVTLGGAVTMNVIGGDGITANANDIAITAAQTTITSIFATDLKIGEDAQTAIDFETANQIHLDANNAQVVNIRAGGIEVTGDVTASAGIKAVGVISGSGFITPLGTVSGFSGSFGDVSASGTILAAKLDALAVSDALAAAIVAEIDNDEIPIAKLAEDAVTVTAGTGLTGAGAVTLGAAVTMNVIGGDGITANANDIAITAAQTTITSIFATDLKIGEDAQTAIDFETANEIHLDANNAEVVNVRAGGIEVTGDVTASAGIHAAAVISGSGFLTPLGTVTALSGAFGDVSASGTILAAKLDALAVSDALAAAIVAEIDNDEIPIAKLAEDAVTVTAGTGLTGAGAVTLGGAVTMNVIGGDGITANANDIAITAAQTTITSIFATDLKIGEDAQTAIDFETANQIHLDANNAQVVNVRAGGIEVTGDVTASAGIHAAAVISGSGFITPLGTVSGFSGSFGDISASGTILAAKLDALAVSDALAAAIVAEIDNDEIPIAKLAEDAVTVTAGTGLTGAGAVTLGAAVTMNVIGGDGITANANDIAITAAQTTIESILKADLIIGEDSQTKIDFETADEIHFDAANAEVMNIRAGGIQIVGDITASAGISASQFNTNYGPAAALGPGTGSFGHVTASFGGDGSRLINVTAAAVDIDGLSALGGTGLHQTQDHFLFSDNGTEKKITFSNLEDAIFGNVSRDVTIAAGGTATVARVQNIAVTAEEMTQVAAIGSATISQTQWGYVGALDQAVQTDSNVSFNNLNVDGNLVVAGTASFEETANLNVKDRFISLASGSATGGDGGIVVNQALGNVPSGSAFGYEAGTADRWAVQANFVPTGSAMVPDAYMGIVTFTTSAPSGNPQYGGANYGYGNIHVDTDDGEIYIFA